MLEFDPGHRLDETAAVIVGVGMAAFDPAAAQPPAGKPIMLSVNSDSGAHFPATRLVHPR